MNELLTESYAFCQRITRASATNFYYSFLLLPRPKRQAMCALYAFLRRTDDLADCQAPLESRRRALYDWRESLTAALQGKFLAPLWPAVADIVERYQIDPQHLHDVIDGVLADLDHQGFATFAELEDYCHHVASAVGMGCLSIWGCQAAEAVEPARACGLAFQLTNILRDLEEDAALGRIYLPQEDLERFGYSADQLRRGVNNQQLRDLMEFEVQRAQSYFDRVAALPHWLDADAQAVLGAMTDVYQTLLRRIARRNGQVFGQRIRLSYPHKLWIATERFIPCAARRSAQLASQTAQRTMALMAGRAAQFWGAKPR